MSSICRFLDPADAATAEAGADVEILNSRRRGGAWTADQMWSRMGTRAALRTSAADRKLEADLAERGVVALVALRPGSGQRAGLLSVGPLIPARLLNRYSAHYCYDRLLACSTGV